MFNHQSSIIFHLSSFNDKYSAVNGSSEAQQCAYLSCMQIHRQVALGNTMTKPLFLLRAGTIICTLHRAVLVEHFKNESFFPAFCLLKIRKLWHDWAVSGRGVVLTIISVTPQNTLCLQYHLLLPPLLPPYLLFQ